MRFCVRSTAGPEPRVATCGGVCVPAYVSRAIQHTVVEVRDRNAKLV